MILLHRPPLIARLRRSMAMAKLGIALLAVQMLTAADHLSAAAALAGGVPFGDRPGIFGICSPVPTPGIRTEGGQSAPGHGGAQGCPVCSTASAAGNAICAEAALLPVPSRIEAVPAAFGWQDSHTSAPNQRYGAVRGPPVPVFA